MQNKYDSEICGNLPVHHINLIQPYGFLIVLRKEDLAIVQVSENVQELLSISLEEIVSTEITSYLSPEEKLLLLDTIGSGIQDKIPITLSLLDGSYKKKILAIVHPKEAYLVMELEYVPEHTPSFMEVFRDLKYSMAAIGQQEKLDGVCQTAVTEIKRLSGYDSVLMYRFDEEWNGTVVAESTVEEMSSYLGLKFPASDVPSQVRKLYLKNPYRMIPDRNCTPVKLYPVINPLINTLTDLSDCNLRSVPSVHLEYMKNMGIDSSLSVRIIVGQRLWGLISCHHRRARKLPLELRSTLELLSNIISGKIAYVTEKMEYDSLLLMNEQRIRIVDYLYKENDWIKSMLSHAQNLLTLFHLQGAAIVYRGKTETLGIVPVKDDLENLVLWLQAKDIQTVYTSNNLSAVNEAAFAYNEIGSGVIVLPLNAANGDFIIGFREEVIKSVHWGGNPDEALVFEENGVNYHPRNSFNVWKQTVKNTSLAWTGAEIKTGKIFRNNLFEYLLKQSAKDLNY